MAKATSNERAAAGHTAAGNNQSTRHSAKEEYRNARRNAWKTHEEGTEQHTRDGHMAASLCSSEPHMAAHITGTAHPAKSVEMHMCVDEDGGRSTTKNQARKRHGKCDGTRRCSTMRHSTSVEPRGAASNSYRSRETIRILAEAKSSFIQKGL